MLCFHNPGELDLRLAQLFGVNVKESNSAIGHFGTGLKYAIAVTLRLGGRLELHSGERRLEFLTRTETIRGKEFQMVYMVDCTAGAETALPFTLELGKTWEPWMAYRELWSNAKDEGGEVWSSETDATPALGPAPGRTLIRVQCEELDTAHRNRNTFILSSKPIWANQHIEIHRPGGHAVFYRGIKVITMQKPGLYSYNILDRMDLTEDRTAKSWWWDERNLITQLMEAPESILIPVLLSNDDFWEHVAEWRTLWGGPHPAEFTRIVTELAKTKRFRLPASLIKVGALAAEPPTPVTLTKVEAVMLERARKFCEFLDYPVTAEIVIARSLSPGVLGTVLDGKIVLSKEAFQQGTKRVAGTLLEEQIHLATGHGDLSLAFQNTLVDLLVSAVETARGEPL